MECTTTTYTDTGTRIYSFVYKPHLHLQLNELLIWIRIAHCRARTFFCKPFLVRCIFVYTSKCFLCLCMHILLSHYMPIHSFSATKSSLKTRAFIPSIVTMTMATQVFENQFRMDLTGNLLAQCTHTHTNTLVAVVFRWWMCKICFDDALLSFTYRTALTLTHACTKWSWSREGKLSIKLHDKNTYSTQTNTLPFVLLQFLFSSFTRFFPWFFPTAVVTASVSHNICIELQQTALRIVRVCGQPCSTDILCEFVRDTTM